MEKRIVLMNDLPGYGRAALSVMMPMLHAKGIHVYNLPTALVSTTLDYGSVEMLDTTAYMKGAVQAWERLGFTMDAVCVGYLVSDEQAAFVQEYCEVQRLSGARILLDPIMADGGRLYNGLTMQHVQRLRKLASVADLVLPNYTEATLLTGEDYRREGVCAADAEVLVSKLLRLGAGSALVTSAKVDGKDAVIGFDQVRNEYFCIPYEAIPVKMPGTGDIFTAVTAGELLDGKPLRESVETAVNTVSKLLRERVADGDDFHGINVEKQKMQ